MQNLLSYKSKKILDFLFPPRCFICSKIVQINYSLCFECWKHIEFIHDPFCAKCGRQLHYSYEHENCKKINNISKIKYAVVYNEFSKKLILKLKYFDDLSISDIMANIIHNSTSYDFFCDIDIIAPVPLHFFRIFKRKYNQSALIGYKLCKSLKILNKWIPDLLIRTRNTKPQNDINQRFDNIKDAFKLSSKYNIMNKKILLIDDVITSGATFYECAKALKSTKEIRAIAFAGPKNYDYL